MGVAGVVAACAFKHHRETTESNILDEHQRSYNDPHIYSVCGQTLLRIKQ